MSAPSGANTAPFIVIGGPIKAPLVSLCMGLVVPSKPPSSHCVFAGFAAFATIALLFGVWRLLEEPRILGDDFWKMFCAARSPVKVMEMMALCPGT